MILLILKNYLCSKVSGTEESKMEWKVTLTLNIFALYFDFIPITMMRTSTRSGLVPEKKFIVYSHDHVA